MNHEPSKDPRFKPSIDDGRNYLLLREHKFDVIISEPSNPWMSGAASLFTKDFFEIAASRLEEDGIFLQWLQLYELAPHNIHALIRTFNSVFPNVLVFTPDPFSNDTLLIGTKKPIKVDKARLEKWMADPKLMKELDRAGVKNAYDFIGLFLMGTNEIPKFVGTGPLNTDDNAMIEFGAPKDLITYATKDARIPFLEAIVGKRIEIVPQYFTGFGEDGDTLRDITYRLLQQGQVTDAEAYLEKAKAAGADVTHIERVMHLLGEADSQPVVVDRPETHGEPRYAHVVVEMTHDREREALIYFESEKNLEEVSTAHKFLYAYLCYRREREVDAEYLMEKVLEDEAFVKDTPSVLYYAGRILSYRGKYKEGVPYIERFMELQTKTATTGH